MELRYSFQIICSIYVILLLLVEGCNTSRGTTTISQPKSILENEVSRHSYSDSLPIILINDTDKIIGSYSLNAGLYMRFLVVDSTHHFTAQDWSDSSGKGRKKQGKWSVAQATIFLYYADYQEAFDVVGYKDDIMLIPVEKREKLGSLLNELAKIEDAAAKQYTKDSAREVINRGHFMLFSRDQILIKDK